ncbi:hypothetical protein DRP05_10605 [Archaeoglobales archaeon]|nr:MAG: hypothetical protein DRP05_10605 [Archaeoglobales archaeon]
MALSGVIGLTIRGAMNEEKYRRNIESLSGVIDCNKEGWQNVNRALQDYITSAEKVNYISKETRARLVSEMITMGTAKDTILKYGPVLEKLGISLGKTTDDVITAIRSSLAGMYRPFKNLGVIIEESKVKEKMEEIRKTHRNWSDEAIRAEAIMEIAYPQMVDRIGDFNKAMDSAYGDVVKFREKLSDLTGDIGAVYIPYLRLAVQWMTRFINVIRSNPILETAFAVGTFGGLVLPKVIQGSRWWKDLTIWNTLAQSRLATAIMTRLIPAQVASAYATGGLTAALRTATIAFKGFAISVLTNPITWAILGIVGAVLLLQHAWVHNWFGIRDKTAAAINFIREKIDWLIGGIKWAIGWIQKLFAFTPVGMGFTAAKATYTAITQHRLELPKIQSITAITPAHQTVHMGGVKADINIHLNDVKLDHTGRVKQLGIEVSKQIEEGMAKALRRQKLAKLV